MKRHQAVIAALTVVLLLSQGAWAATTRYRSVGPGNTLALVVGGTGNQLSVQSGTATMTFAAPPGMGVGDVIQYDTNGDGTVDTLAFVSARTNATTFTVVAADGSAPLAVPNASTWTVYRAYTSLANAAACSENSSIAAALQNFDPYPAGMDLVALDSLLYVACYADGVDTTPVDWPATWITDATRYIRIFTPHLDTEAGASQRHNGVLGAGYLLSVAGQTPLSLHANNVRLKGLQLETRSVTGGQICVYFYGSAGDYQAAFCIFHGDPAGTGTWNLGIEMETGVGAGTVRVWNCMFYDFHNSNGSAMEAANTAYTAYFYNNTIVNCNNGLIADGGTVVVKNTIVQNCANSYTGTYAPGSDYNLSGAADAPGANSVQNATVVFLSPSDFHLSAFDTAAHGRGTDLSADINQAITDDIDGQTRVVPWDIGADQCTSPPYSPTFTPTVTPTRTSTVTPLPGSPTFTPTNSYTQTVTPSATPTVTLSGTWTSTRTVTLTNPPSATITLTPTVSSTATATLTVTREFTSSPTPFGANPGQVLSYPSPGKGGDLWFIFQAEAAGNAMLSIYNLAGEKLTTLNQAVNAPGQVRVHWDIRRLASGVYFYRLQTEQGQDKKDWGLKKLVIAR